MKDQVKQKSYQDGVTKTLYFELFSILSLRGGLSVLGDHGVSAGISDNIVWISTDKQHHNGLLYFWRKNNKIDGESNKFGLKV